MTVREKGGNNKVEGKKIRLPEKNLQEAENNLEILLAEGLPAAEIICYSSNVEIYAKELTRMQNSAIIAKQASKQASKQA